MFVTEARVALSSLTSPVPGSAMLVELSYVYFHANAPAEASALVALVADAVALDADAVALLALAVALEAEAVAELEELVA